MHVTDDTAKRALDAERDEVLRQLEDWLETPMLVLGFVWLALLVFELTWGLSPLLEIAGTVIWVVFIIDFGVKFTLAWQMRTDPQNLRMKQLVREGTLGRIVMVRRRHALSTHVWPGFENSWHVKPELNRGMWADDASHAISSSRWPGT